MARRFRYSGVRSWPLERRLEFRIERDPNSGCWLWNGSLGRQGYGSIRVNGRTECAHRASWTTYVGPIPGDLCVLHRCDTPACINPDHLFLGSKGDNNADRHSKGRDGDHKGERHGLAKLDDQAVSLIRAYPPRRGHTRELAERFGVSKATIGKVRRRVSWAHVA